MRASFNSLRLCKTTNGPAIGDYRGRNLQKRQLLFIFAKWLFFWQGKRTDKLRASCVSRGCCGGSNRLPVRDACEPLAFSSFESGICGAPAPGGRTSHQQQLEGGGIDHGPDLVSPPARRRRKTSADKWNSTRPRRQSSALSGSPAIAKTLVSTTTPSRCRELTTVSQDVHQLAEWIAHKESTDPPGLVGGAILDRDLCVLHSRKGLFEIVDLDR